MRRRIIITDDPNRKIEVEKLAKALVAAARVKAEQNSQAASQEKAS